MQKLKMVPEAWNQAKFSQSEPKPFSFIFKRFMEQSIYL